MPELSDRPVEGYDSLADRRQGWIDPRTEQSGHTRVTVYGPDGGILGHVYLSLVEFAKIASVIKKDVGRLFGSDVSEELPW